MPVTAQWGVTAEERTEVSLSSQSPSSHCNSITCLQTERILRVRAGFLACPHIPSTHHDVRHTQHTGSAFAGCQGPSKPQVKPHCPKVYHEEKKVCLIVRTNPKTQVYTILNMKYFIYTNCHKSAFNLQSEFMKHKYFAQSSSYYHLNTVLFPRDL